MKILVADDIGVVRRMIEEIITLTVKDAAGQAGSVFRTITVN